MDPFSITAATVALPSAFFGIVQTLDAITLAKNFGHDSEVAFVKLVLLKARLEVWVESMSQESRNDENFGLGNVNTKPGKAVRLALQTLQAVVSEGDEFASKYGLQGVSTSSSTAVTPAPLHSLMAFSHRSRLRQQQSTTSRKAKWAVIHKNKFERLLSDLAPIIDSLEGLGNSYLQRSTRLREEAMREMVASVSSEMKSLLLEAAEAAKPQMEAGQSNVPDSGATNGHYYLRILLEAESQAIYGDVGTAEPGARRHVYTDMKASGNSVAIYGNAHGVDLSDFFGGRK